MHTMYIQDVKRIIVHIFPHARTSAMLDLDFPQIITFSIVFRHTQPIWCAFGCSSVGDPSGRTRAGSLGSLTCNVPWGQGSAREVRGHIGLKELFD